MAGKVKRALNIRGSMVPIPSPVLWLFSLLWYVVRLLAGRCWAGLLWLSSSCATAVTRAFERIGRKSTRNTGERNQTRTASRCSPRKRMPPWVSLFPSISSPEIDQHETKLLLSQFHRCTFPSFFPAKINPFNVCIVVPFYKSSDISSFQRHFFRRESQQGKLLSLKSRD